MTLNAHHARPHGRYASLKSQRGPPARLGGSGARGDPRSADCGSCPRVVARAVFKFPVRGPGSSREYLINWARATEPLISTQVEGGVAIDIDVLPDARPLSFHVRPDDEALLSDTVCSMNMMALRAGHPFLRAVLERAVASVEPGGNQSRVDAAVVRTPRPLMVAPRRRRG